MIETTPEALIEIKNIIQFFIWEGKQLKLAKRP